MFAIVATSGKQFRVTEGDRIVVDRVSAGVGETVRLDSVLLVGGDDKPLVGMPFIEGAAVEATVVAHRAGDKVIVFKFESRKRKRRKIGHRQMTSELRIGSIRAPGRQPSNGQQAEKQEAPKAGARSGGRSRRTAKNDTVADPTTTEA